MKILIFTLSILTIFAHANEALIYCNKQISPGAGAGFVPVTNSKSLTLAAPNTITYKSYSYSLATEKIATYIKSIGLNKKSLSLENGKNIIYLQSLNPQEYSKLKTTLAKNMFVKLSESTKITSPVKVTNGGYLGGMCVGSSNFNSTTNALLFKSIINKNLAINVIYSGIENNLNKPFRLDADIILPANHSSRYVVIFGKENNSLISGKIALIDFIYHK